MARKYFFYSSMGTMLAVGLTTLTAVPAWTETPAIKIPADAGDITQSVAASPAHSSNKHLVLIQDIHVNYEAHRNIARILDELAQEEGLELVLMEGAEGDVNVEFLKKYGTSEITAKSADNLLHQGMISGTEYAQLTSDHTFYLWGVEDLSLYKQNFKAYENAGSLQEKLKPLIEKLREQTLTMAEAIFNAELKELLLARQAYKKTELSVNDYTALLLRLAEQLDFDDEHIAHIRNFSRALKLGKALNAAEIESEQSILIEALDDAVPTTAMESLIEASRTMRSEQDKQLYYKQLLDLASAYAPEKKATNIQNYLEYLQALSHLDAVHLLKALDISAMRLGSLLVSSTEEQQLLIVWQGLESLTQLVSLEWTSSDYVDYMNNQANINLQRWYDQLQEIALSQQIELTEFDIPNECTRWTQEIAAFYEIANSRNQAIVDRILEKMSTTSIAALVVGGFHTNEIINLLDGSGISVTVITPLTNEETDHDLYDYVMRFRQGYHRNDYRL